MEPFVKRFEDRIEGMIAGPDRILFRGTLRPISCVEGMEVFLRPHKILNRDFPQSADSFPAHGCRVCGGSGTIVVSE